MYVCSHLHLRISLIIIYPSIDNMKTISIYRDWMDAVICVDDLRVQGALEYHY